MTIKTTIKTSKEFEELKRKDTEYNELESMIIDSVEAFKERQFAIFFKASQVEEFKKYVLENFTVIENDGYFYCYCELSNGARKELKELVG